MHVIDLIAEELEDSTSFKPQALQVEQYTKHWLEMKITNCISILKD